MTYSKKTLAAITASCAIASTAFSDVTLTGQVGALRDSFGDYVNVGSLAILVADISNNGIDSPLGTSLSAGSFLSNNADDLIISAGFVTDLGGVIGYDFGGTSFSYSGAFTAGDSFYLLWFPTLTSLGDVVGNNVSYGIYRSDGIDFNSGSAIAWVAPADGGSYNLSAFDNVINPGSIASPADLTANFITPVPEPSTFAAFAGLGVLGWTMVRRRKVRAA